MKICIFTATIDKKGGGPSRSVPIMAKGLAEVGVEVTLMVGESDDMNTHAIEGHNVELITFPHDINTKDLEMMLLFGKYDLIHAQGIWIPLYHKMSKIARRHNIPYMMTPRGALEPWCYYDKNLMKRFKKRLAMYIYQRKDLQSASCILATADMEASSLRNLSFSNPIAVIPNGIEANEYLCRPEKALAECKKQVVFLSRIDPKKGIDILIDAWVKVHYHFPDWKVIIVGNGEQEYIETLNKQIVRNGLSDYIRLLPPAFGKDKYKLYIESSLFVLPTHSENFGMVIAEALACGVPVITTKGTPWKILEDSSSGWWIELSQKNLENTLLKALALPAEKLFEMGQRGAKMVRDNFDYVEVAQRLYKTYKWILDNKERPTFVI